MENPIETIEYNGYTIKIYLDSSVDSPRTWDDFGKMSLFHKKYKFPNELNMTMEECKRLESNKDWLVLPVYMLDHSGVALSTEPFDDPWDSGRVGIIAVEKSEMSKYFLSEKQAIENLKSEVKTYSQYLNGEVYGYVIEGAEDEELDSCWNFIGFDSAVEAAKIDIDTYYKE